MKKICVFPNDPLLAYHKKGEIKPRYFNPKNLFDEVHVISMFDEDIESKQVQTMAGIAKLKIHTVGKVTLINKDFMKKKIFKLIEEIGPDIIRAYNPILQGWMGAKIKEKFNIPLVISIHGDYNRDRRYFAKKQKDWKMYLKYLYSKKDIEPFAIKSADEIIIVYEFLRKYAEEFGAKKINLLYNRVNLEQFNPKNRTNVQNKIPIVLCVGRLRKDNKNQECLIRAVKNLDVKLQLIGDGPEYKEYSDLVKELKIDHKVEFHRSVPHEKIKEIYSNVDIYAYAPRMGGIAIPVFEAVASGLPVIHSKQEFDNDNFLHRLAMVVENTPEAFEIAIKEVISNPKLRNDLVMKGLHALKEIDGDIMEEKEKKIYERIISNYSLNKF